MTRPRLNVVGAREMPKGMLQNIRLLLLSIAALFVCSPALAFDLSPEYQGLSERDLTRIEAPGQIDFEYQSAWNSYALSQHKLVWWFGQTRAFETSAGSLTGKHFLIQQRLKLTTDLTETLQFRLTHLIQQDLETDQSRFILELEQKIFDWLKVSAYGQPALYKRENDAGFALTFLPTAGFTARAYYTLHDFTRRDHNDQPDRYTSGQPNSIGLNVDYLTGDVFLRGGFREDQDVTWNRPQEQRDFYYGRELYYLEGRLQSQESIWSARTQFDTTLKGQSPLAGSTLPNERWTLERNWVRLSYLTSAEDTLETARFTYELSAMFVGRKWTNQNGAHLRHANWMPGLTTRTRLKERTEGADYLQTGLEVTEFRITGDEYLRPSHQNRVDSNYRLQIAYEFGLKNQAKLFFAGNFDLDEWRNIPTFDGGNVQFQTAF